MQHRPTKLFLGALLVWACVYASFAFSSAPPTGESVPLARDLLDGPVPNDRYSLEITAAEMFQLGLVKEAGLLESYGVRTTYLHLLNRPYTPAASVREAVQREAGAQIPLDQLSADFMREGYTIQVDTMLDRDGPDRNMIAGGYPTAVAKLMPLQPGLWALFDLPKTHTAGLTMGDAATLFIRMQIRNQTVESEAFRLQLPIGGMGPMACDFNYVAPGATARTYCEVVMLGYTPEVKERIVKNILAMLDGRPLAPMGTYSVGSESYPNGVSSWTPPWKFSPEERFGGDAWFAAQHNIANAGCQKLGTCRHVYTGYIANGGVLSMVITAAFMILTLYLRWRGELGEGRVFSVLFVIYFCFVLLAGFLFYIDPPPSGAPSRYYEGLFSTLAAGALSLPWSYFMSVMKEAVPYRAIRDLGQRDFALQWVFIIVNLTYLGFMGYLRRARRA